MIKNYFKIAWRNVARKKVYTAINVLGLALGICACTVIYVITSHELSFDTFHPGKERIYRIMGDVTQDNGEKLHFSKVPLTMSQSVRSELTGLDVIAGVCPFYNTKITIAGIGKQAEHFTDGNLVISESQYFDIFPYQWLAGSVSKAPFTVVLTESRAHQYFGSLSLDNIVGREVVYADSLHVRVTGIVKDWHKNTDFPFTDFISYNTIQSSFLKNNISNDEMSTWTFAKLSAGTAPAQINGELRGLIKRHHYGQTKLALRIQPLSAVHFDGDVIENPIRTAHMPTLYGLMGIALFILILAVINFINLSTAQSLQRAKEVGVRKVMGSSRTSLIFQFLTETFVLTFFAVILAVILVKPVLTGFRSFIPSGVSFSILDPSTISFVVVVTLVTSLLAGFYPAKVLSSYLPVLSLKGAGVQKGGDKWYLRKGLIVFQFIVSLVFIIVSIVISRQLSYIRNKDLGFSADAIVTLETPRGDSLSKVKVLAQKVKQLSGVSRVALEWATPGDARGMNIKFKNTDVKEVRVGQVDGNEDLIPLYQIKLLAGRNLLHSDSVNEFVINESLSKLMGFKTPADAIGKMIYWFNKPYPVVGVTADFHSSSLHSPIVPLCIINRVEREGTLAVKLATKGKNADAIKTTLAQIAASWKSVYSETPFDYHFYDESLAMAYEKDQQTAALTNSAMMVTIFISCIGLFGLAMFTAEKRAKEISIRKILGASATAIAALLSKDFIILIIIALFVASPIAWYFMHQWLQSFAYRIDISIWVYVLAGAGAILIALITISFQSIKAALANPVKSLRSE